MPVKKVHPKILAESIKLTNSPRNAFIAGKDVIESLSKGFQSDDKINAARQITYLIVKSYWESIYENSQHYELPPLETQSKLNNVDAALALLADALGKAASKLDFIDASYQIGCIYTSLLPNEYRSAKGIYFTPPAVTYRIITMAENAGVDWTSAKILDPACGGGAFLAPIALRIAAAFKSFDSESLITHVETHLSGYEIDAFSAWLSQVFVEVALNKICRQKNKRLKPLIKVCDTLSLLNQKEKFDLIIGNPPYGKIKLDESKREEFKEGLYGHANLYGLFTQFALSNLTSKGIIAFVTPTSFLSGEYFKNLRSLICKNTFPVEFDFVFYRQGIFEDVLQETVLATYKSSASSRQVKVNELNTETDNRVTVKEIGFFPLPQDKSRPWVLPRSLEQSELLRKVNQFSETLLDWGYTVKTGPLVWNRHKPQLSSAKRKKTFPLIWAESITNDGNFVWRADKKNHTLYFEAYHNNNWLLTDYPCILMQRTTAKEQHRRLITTILPQSFLDKHKYVVIENHVNIIKSITAKPKVSLKALNIFLNSKATDIVFRCISGSVAVSAYEIEQLPLPPSSKLVRLEKLIKNGSSAPKLEQECYELYNLSE